MREPLATLEQHTSTVWMRFQEVVQPQVLIAPRISWDRVDRKLMNYINTCVAGTPWANHFAFLLQGDLSGLWTDKLHGMGP